MHILEIPTELLHLVFTNLSEQRRKSKSHDIGLKGLRLLCRAFNNAIVPILFSHITIDMRASLEPSMAQIDQLARSHERGCAYRIAQTLKIRALDAMHIHHTHRTRGAQQVNARLAVIDAGLTTAVTALTGLRDVHWSINPTDSTARVAAVVEGLCVRPPDLKLDMQVEYFADSMHLQLLRIGMHLTSFSVTALARESFLTAQQPEDLKILSTLVAGSPRLERLEFHRHVATRLVGLDLNVTPPADFDLDAVFSALPPHRTCPPHLVLDGLRVQHITSLHRLRALQSLTLFIPLPRMIAHENDMWLDPLWGALGAAHVFPPTLIVDGLGSALIGYITRHPGLDTLSLRWLEHGNEPGALAAIFFTEALPRHARTLRHLTIEFLDLFDPTLPERTIARCALLETFATQILWTDQLSFTDALAKLLLLLSGIPAMRRLTLTLVQAYSDVTPEVEGLVWRVLEARVFEDETLHMPAEVVICDRRFGIARVGLARRYVLLGRVGE